MKNLDRLSKKRLGEILIDEGLCTRDQIETALAVQAKSPGGAPLGEILLDTIPEMNESDISRAISKQFQFPCLYAANYKVDADAIELIARPLLYEYVFIPVGVMGNVLLIIMGGLLTAELISQIESETGKEVFIYVSTASDVLAALNTHAPFNAGGDDAGAVDDSSFDWEAMFDEADQQLLSED